MDDIKWWNNELPPMEEIKQCECNTPDWERHDIKDNRFGVMLYAIRICKVCGVKQVYNYSEGRHGGIWRTVKNKE